MPFGLDIAILASFKMGNWRCLRRRNEFGAQRTVLWLAFAALCALFVLQVWGSVEKYLAKRSTMTLDSGVETSLPLPSLALCPGFRPSMPSPRGGRLEDTGGSIAAALEAYFLSGQAEDLTLDEWQYIIFFNFKTINSIVFLCAFPRVFP